MQISWSRGGLGLSQEQKGPRKPEDSEGESGIRGSEGNSSLSSDSRSSVAGH